MSQTAIANFEKPIGCYSPSVQELIVIDNVLSAMVGVEGHYILIKTVCGKSNDITFLVDPSMDLALQELAKRIFPLCKSFLLINQFVESRSQFQSGLVNHAFSAALRALLLVGFPEYWNQPIGHLGYVLNISCIVVSISHFCTYHIALIKKIKIHYLNMNLLLSSWGYLYQDYQAMVAQLEHQFRLGRLSLQGLWFYCQPMMRSMQGLSTVIQRASVNNISGSAVLNLLQSQAKAMAGDNAVRMMLEKMAQCASSAYMSILERWVYEGVIDDPYGEFFIAEDKSLQKESLTQDYEAKYWRQRYSLKDGIPSFLANIAGTILTTGKYLNVMRECGHNVQVPPSENSKLMSFGSNHHYLECIKAAYNFASGELLNLIKDKYDLTGRLRSIKHYLLLDQGDFLVHFMDIARDELAKKLDEVSVEKLQERSSLLRRLGTFNDLEVTLRNSGDNDLEEPVSITGLETFSLSYKVHWPLSIVLSSKALIKYQLLFRFLFHCKHVDRQLCGAWQVHQVIEPNWHLMYNKLQSAKSIDECSPRRQASAYCIVIPVWALGLWSVVESGWGGGCLIKSDIFCLKQVIQHHDFFLDKCLRECLLLLPELLKKVERLKSMCLQYAAATQWLISSSIELHNPVEPIDDSKGLNKAKWKSGQVLKSTTRNVAVTDSVLKFEKEFNTELQSLGSILSSNSQAEPYLSHLAQWLLGVKNEKNGL
ncbi:Gamma-tubulin complex component 2 [Glycine max]|nr:Gamma-tubulin complex component 2 [Glycine max]